jgi:hypothetical protein
LSFEPFAKLLQAALGLYKMQNMGSCSYVYKKKARPNPYYFINWQGACSAFFSQKKILTGMDLTLLYLSRVSSSDLNPALSVKIRSLQIY